MYREDLAPYPASGPDEEGLVLVSVGWLDEAMPFAVGEVDQGVIERVKRRCVFSRVAVTRGFHPCNFGHCKGRPPYPPLKAEVDGRAAALGSSEIRVVDSGKNRIFCAPNLIIHYMEEHGYMPPQEFLRAVG